jgi:hypothetical protein
LHVAVLIFHVVLFQCFRCTPRAPQLIQIIHVFVKEVKLGNNCPCLFSQYAIVRNGIEMPEEITVSWQYRVATFLGNLHL